MCILVVLSIIIIVISVERCVTGRVWIRFHVFLCLFPAATASHLWYSQATPGVPTLLSVSGPCCPLPDSSEVTHPHTIGFLSHQANGQATYLLMPTAYLV